MRRRWTQACRALAQSRQEKLTVLWLANDQFSDLTPASRWIGTAVVPEGTQAAHVAKQRHLDAHPKLQSWVQLPPDPTTAHTVLVSVKTVGGRFDLINLDFCTCLSPEVEQTIALILRAQLLREHGQLFLTVARASWYNKYGGVHGQRIARDPNRIIEQVLSYARLTGRHLQPLPNFPVEYRGQGGVMYSFGWTFFSR